MPRSIRAIALALLGFASPTLLSAQGQVVGPGGTVVKGSGSNWIPFTQAGGTAQVTRDNPRFGYGDVGEGSLRLSVTGQQVGGQYPDWAFWYRYAGGTAESSLLNLNNGGSFGALSQLSQLSFDWFRTSIPGWDTPCEIGPNQPLPPCDWAFKTPVLRLQLAETVGDQLLQTELIWEGYFNQQAPSSGGIGGLTPVDQWVTSANLHQGNFWYVRPALGTGVDPDYSTVGEGVCELNSFTFWQGNAEANALSQLLGENGCIGSNAQVIGIAVGVGSQWPLEYLGYADNVRMEFNGQTVLDANFDYVVPEPSTYAMIALGLGVLGMLRKRRRM